LFFNGASQKLYVGYNSRQDELNVEGLKSCELETGRTMHFYIKGTSSQITVSTHYEKEEKYNTCATIEADWKQMELFYVNFFARSVRNAPFMAEARSMVLSSDVENIGVSLFESQVDDNVQKLFRQISFYKLNNDFIKAKKAEMSNQPMDIKSLYDSQTQVLSIIDYTNTLLDKNLEEGEDMIEFLGQQKGTTQNYARSLLESMNNWITDTSKQFELIENDARDLIAEYENFDLDLEFEKTKTILSQVTKKVGANWEAFQNFRLYADQVRGNLQYLKKNAKNLEQFPAMIEKYINSNWGNSNDSYGNTILLVLIAFGVLSIIALFAILNKISGASRKTRTFAD
jgi:hypothetical protein